MEVRKATINDIDEIYELLKQVHEVHSKNRNDIFKTGATKYDKNQIKSIINNKNTPIYVYEYENKIIGYVFVIYKLIKNDRSLQDRKTLYIDDLCVDEKYRNNHIATKLFEYIKDIAIKNNL